MSTTPTPATCLHCSGPRAGLEYGTACSSQCHSRLVRYPTCTEDCPCGGALLRRLAEPRLPERWREQETGPILTVATLKAALASVPGDVQVLLGMPTGYPGSEYLNVTSLVTPGQDGDGYAAFTLMAADTYDSRQF